MNTEQLYRTQQVLDNLDTYSNTREMTRTKLLSFLENLYKSLEAMNKAGDFNTKEGEE